MGVIVMGKVESGCCRVGDKCLIMPNRTRVEVTNIYYEEIETDSCVCGENVRLKLKNVEEEVISKQIHFSIDKFFFLQRKSLLVSFFVTPNKSRAALAECSTLKSPSWNTNRSFARAIRLFFMFMPQLSKFN